jgi:hypothetical protein
MSCRDCCTCDCHEDEREVNESLQEFLYANNHPDSRKLTEFLTFFKKYNDPLIYDPDWYTHDRLMDLFNSLNVTL